MHICIHACLRIYTYIYIYIKYRVDAIVVNVGAAPLDPTLLLLAVRYIYRYVMLKRIYAHIHVYICIKIGKKRYVGYMFIFIYMPIHVYILSVYTSLYGVT